MWGYTGIISGMSMILAIFLTIIIMVLYKDLYSVYTSFKPSELKTVFYAFTSFLFAALNLVTFNLIALILSTTYLYGKTGIPLFIHELSFIFYNLYLAFGLALFIYTDFKYGSKRIKENIVIASFTLAIATTLTYTTLFYIKLTAFIVALEVFILLASYVRKVRGTGNRNLFSGKLWAAALLLIFIARLICVFNLIPFSYLSIIYLDIFAFASLLLLHIEAEFELREDKR